MQLKVFKTLWGYSGSYADATKTAVEQGFDGIEAPIPKTKESASAFAQELKETNLDYIAEVATTGSFIPNRKLSVTDHLEDLKQNLERLDTLKPMFITCLGGCDAWTENDSLYFFQSAQELCSQNDIEISFETHRGRIFFNPWVTERILNKEPNIKITCDFSHWCVVCEGLQSTEDEIIGTILGNAHHIHARVGYDQGAQVPDPRTNLFDEDMKKHFYWWQSIWNKHNELGKSQTTTTPEFGPDRYEYFDPVTGEALVDIDEINVWMMKKLRTEFVQRLN